MLVVIEKAFADASAAAKTGRDSFIVDRIIGVGGNRGGIMYRMLSAVSLNESLRRIWILFH